MITRRDFMSTAVAAGTCTVAWNALAASDAAASSAKARVTLPGREVTNMKAVPFPMSNVRLLAGPFLATAQANSRYLKTLPVDRLLHTFRLNAGLPSSATPLGDWEKPDCQLRGHFAGGHYLSACAMARLFKDICTVLRFVLVL